MCDNQQPMYPYSDFSPACMRTSGNYWHNLSDLSHHALKEVEQLVQKDNINLSELCINYLSESLLLLRYLRANRFNVAQTMDHIKGNLEWRAANKVSDIVKLGPDDILGCRIGELTNVFPHWHHGYDKVGKPVVYQQYGKFDATRIKELCGGNFDRLIKYHVWQQEELGAICVAQSHATHTLIETISAVIDVEGMTLLQMSLDFMALGKTISEVDRIQYPETMDKLFIINAPYFFGFMWDMVCPFIDSNTYEKIRILGVASEYVPILHQYIGEENLPVNYGGVLPALTADVHPYAETIKKFPVNRSS